MMIAVPMPLMIQGDNEQIGLFKIFQSLWPGSRWFEQNGITKGAA